MKPKDRVVSLMVKGEVCQRVKLRGVEMCGEVISKEERFDPKISRLYPTTFYVVKWEDGTENEYMRSELRFI